MKILIDLEQEQMEKLLSTLKDPEFRAYTELISIDWYNPYHKQNLYRVSTDGDLEKMVTEFNKLIEGQGLETEFKSQEELSTRERWTMLEWLNSNAQWDCEHELIETWLEEDKHLMEEELNKNPELIRSVSRTDLVDSSG